MEIDIIFQTEDTINAEDEDVQGTMAFNHDVNYALNLLIMPRNVDIYKGMLEMYIIGKTNSLNNQPQPQAYIINALEPLKPSVAGWYPYSGATRHITVDQNLINLPTSYQG